MLSGDRARGTITDAQRPWLRKAQLARQALAARRYLIEGGAEHLAQISEELRGDLELVRLLAIECLHPRRTVSVDQLFAVASTLVPFLTSGELRAVWDKLKAASCAPRLGEPQRTWVALITAVGERDAAKMAELAEKLLRQGAGHSDYLLGAAVTGRLALNERKQAVALWREFAEKTVSSQNDTLPDLLRGHLFSHPSRGQGGQGAATPK
jgi:hypothetical protein